MLLSQQLPLSISHALLQYIKCLPHSGKMVKAPMEDQFNFHQSILSHPNPSETEVTSQPANSPSGTPLSNSPLNADNAIMGKCLSVCKERKTSLGENEGPADTPSPSPDRNDPSKILTHTSRAPAHISRTNGTIGGIHALTDDVKHAGHFGLTFISLSPIDHQKAGQGEQISQQEANNVQESHFGESEQQGNVTPAACGSQTAGYKPEENDQDDHQPTRDLSPSDAGNITPQDHHSGQENQEEHHSPLGVHANHLDENDSTQGSRSEEENTNEVAQFASAMSEASSHWINLFPMIQSSEGLPINRTPESSMEKYKMRRGLRRLLEISRPHSQNICVASCDGNVTEIDILCPGVLDGPPMQTTIPFNPQHPKSLMELSNPVIQVLRLPRLHSCKSFDLDGFLHLFVKNSWGVKELVFEDAGQISKGTAEILADIKSLERLEVYDPKVPLLRALTIGDSNLKKLCLHGLTKDVERDLRLYINHKGASLHSLSLSFSISARKTEWTTGQKEFFGRILRFLDYAVAGVLSDLLTLEVSSCPSYEVKHSFDGIGSTSRTEQLPLYHIDMVMRTKQRAPHPKASMISLKNLKLRGHFAAIKDSLEVLSWVNQEKMEIKVELPGVSAFYLRGFGIMKPVVLTFLQLDKFISQEEMFPWLELTALREIDVGEIEFIRKYNADNGSMRRDTRKLLVTSRESLSRVRICFKIPTRDICLETRKFLGEIVPLTPLVSHLDISRDIVLHASVGDNEYMETIMLLRDWNLKTVQLVSTQNYGTIETANADAESDGVFSTKKNCTEEFIRKLPAFLTLLAGACPKLENLVVESEEMCNGWMKCEEQARLLEDGMKSLEVFERVVPTVKVGTLRGQLQAWENIFPYVSNTDE